jgi:hypothetical protein
MYACTYIHTTQVLRLGKLNLFFLVCTHTQSTAGLCVYPSLILNSFTVDKHDDTSHAGDLILFLLRMFVKMFVLNLNPLECITSFTVLRMFVLKSEFISNIVSS